MATHFDKNNKLTRSHLLVIVAMDSLEIVVLDKLLELLDVADGQQVLLDVWQVHQAI